MAGQLPSGIVTFLFTDIEGSTRLLQALGSAYAPALASHRNVLREAIEGNAGHVFGMEGDAVFAAFADPGRAVAAAADAQRALAASEGPEGHEVRVRMGIHTGEATVVGDDYVGLALHQAARIAASGHGGQVVLSEATRALAGDGSPGGPTIRDLGEHRLKDLARPIHLYDLVIAGLEHVFPPLRTLDARPNNLPEQVDSFVGRAELEAARALLDQSRLLTLLGPGGTGKTRLALQLAGEVAERFPGGIWFVPLEMATEAAQIPAATVEAIGLDVGSDPPLDRLVAHLADRQTLLVLDNLEQIAEPAPVVARILGAGAGVRIVATSRVPLHVSGEQEFPVPPLALPTPGAVRTAADAAPFEAVQLFIERAMAVQPSFRLADDHAALVAEIVVRVDGLPLAIELAAARIRLLPVPALLARLKTHLTELGGGARDRPTRQQTLRGAIDWSHDLLDEVDRRLFRRFAVFAGGANLGDIERVCGPAGELGGDVLDALGSLVEKSLVRTAPGEADEARFSMLGTIREYALERLEQANEADDLRRRHAAAYLELVEFAAGELTGSSGKTWLDRIELDHENLRAVLDRAVEADDAETALRGLAAIWRFWQMRGHLHEATERVQRILALPGLSGQPPGLRSRARVAAGSIAYWRGDYPAVHRYYREALDDARASGDRALIAEALYNFSFAPTPTAGFAENVEPGLPVIAEALDLYRDLGDRRGIANTTWLLGIGALTHNNAYEEAIRHFDEALGAYRELGDRFGAGWALHEKAIAAIHLGDLPAAERSAREALQIFAGTNDVSAAVLLLLDHSLIAHRAGEHERGWLLAGAADSLRQDSGADVAVLGGFGEIEMPVRPDAESDQDGARLWDEGASWQPETAIAFALREG